MIFRCFFTVNNEHIHSVLQSFVFALTIPFTFSEIMKALLLVEHLLVKILINTNWEEIQGFSLHLAVQDLNWMVLPYLLLLTV